MQHSRQKTPLFICMVLRSQLSISIDSINFKAPLAFPVPSPDGGSKPDHRFALQA